MRLRKVISGGQTGADRAGLVAASLFGLETGGTAPQGYRTLDGSDYELRDLFGLKEHWSSSYPPRTECNVKDSDGSIRIARNFDSSGEKLTLRLIKKHGKPYFDIDEANPPTPERFAEWLSNYNIEVLNVAGNSEHTAPGIYRFALNFLLKAFRIAKERDAQGSAK